MPTDSKRGEVRGVCIIVALVLIAGAVAYLERENMKRWEEK